MSNQQKSFGAAEVAAYIAEQNLDLEQQGDEWRGACPIHRGSRDSFAMNALNGTWYCHSACQRGGDLFELEALLTGAQPERVRSTILGLVEGKRDQNDHNVEKRIVAEYSYTDPNGVLLYQCVRFEPKDFRQRRPDGKGGWIWKLDDVETVLYHLPQAVAANVVYIVEGEKDVHTLESLGVVATCNPMGAGKWRAHYAKSLRGKIVIIVPDNDDPGRKHAAAVADSLLGVAASVRIVEIGPAGKDVSDFAAAGGTRDQLEAVAAAATVLAPEALTSLRERWGIVMPKEVATGSNAPVRNPTQSDKLLDLANSAKLFHTSEHEAYAQIQQNGHSETWSLRSAGFERWLRKEYFRVYRGAPGKPAVQDAIANLTARAHFDGAQHAVYLRLARSDERIYLDLANERWEAVEIGKVGWRIVQDVPVFFRRPKGMAALPMPQTGGTLDDLRDFINTPDDDTFIPVVAWLVGALRPSGPYALLSLQGEQGSAKSSLAKVLRALIDPASSPLRTLPRDERDLMIAANNNWVLAFDNLSGIDSATSDSFCRVSSGGGLSTRELYSDSDETIFDAMRPIILNGIDDMVERHDLADRSLIVNLPGIPDSKRRTEDQLWLEFEAARPRIIGALCDAVSMALRNANTLSIPALPRMADFASWVMAAESALPWSAGAFLDTFQRSRKDAIAVALEGDAVAVAISKLTELQNTWQGTATQLLEQLDLLVADSTRKSRVWPKSPNSLSKRILRVQPFMRAGGVTVEHSRVPGSGRRLITISRDSKTIVTSVTPVTVDSPSQRVAPRFNQIAPVTVAPEISPAEDSAPSQTDTPLAQDCDSGDECDAPIPTMSKNLNVDLELDL